MYSLVRSLLAFNFFGLFLLSDGGPLLTLENSGSSGAVSLRVKFKCSILQLDLSQGGAVKLSGSIGTRLSNTSDYSLCRNVSNCIEFDNGSVRLHVLQDVEDAYTIFWTTDDVDKVLEDCFDLGNYNWYGGPERFQQRWPVEKLTLDNFANVLQEDQWGAVVEPYWLNSVGAYIFVDERVPLFINQNTASTRRRVCFSARSGAPYPPRSKLTLHYTIVAAKDPKQAHLHAVHHFLGKPTGHPNYQLIQRPIWSTWARYKRDVSDTAVLEFAQNVHDNGYPYGQFEIDDNWEECYGALVFNKSRFGDITETVKKIKALNFTVTLWTHPFVNHDCTKYMEIGRKYNYFVKNASGFDLTQWWNSNRHEAHYLDFTNPEVRNWFVERLRALQINHGIDSFKFDAGETSWAPPVSVLNGDPELKPNNLAEDYVRTCARFGDLVEVRSAWKTQDLPIFVRMIDKDSNWGVDNGLYTLITTMLQMNLNGYTMVLPDMVGGNGYYGVPDAELFVRWLEANVFMPSIQFSYVPWDYVNNAIPVQDISKNMVDLHEKFAPYIKKQMERSINEGYPVNAPIWWVDPTNSQALAEDTEYLLGEDILAAPIIEQGAVSRNVYLPAGEWIDGNNGIVHSGPLQLANYNAPIGMLPYFVRSGSYAHSLLQEN